MLGRSRAARARVRSPIDGHAATRVRGLGAITWTARAALAGATTMALAAGMSWVVAGRLDAAWPARNLLEATIRDRMLAIVDRRGFEPALPGSISGRVTAQQGEAMADPSPTDAARDGAIPGATVLVVDADGNVVETLTDAAGAYELHGLSPGRYRVIASAPGFAPSIVERRATAREQVGERRGSLLSGTNDPSPIERLSTWAWPGVEVTSDAATSLGIVLRRPARPPLALARNARLPEGPDEPVACAPGGGRDPAATGQDGPDSRRESDARGGTGAGRVRAVTLPVDVTGAGEWMGSFRRYRPDSSNPVVARGGQVPAVVAIVPVGSEEAGCAAVGLASLGVDVIVFGVAPDPRPDRQVLAVRALLAAAREGRVSGGAVPSATVDAATSLTSGAVPGCHATLVDGAGTGTPVALLSLAHGSAPSASAPCIELPPVGGTRRGPVVVGAGFAAAVAMRAVADEAAMVPWSPDRGDPGSGSEGTSGVGRGADVAARVGGVVLVVPVLDLFAARRDARTAGLPDYLDASLRAVGPADREVGRLVRYSARHWIDPAFPPVVIVDGPPGSSYSGMGGEQREATAAWARLARGAGVRVEMIESAGPEPWDEPALLEHVIARTVSLARAP